VPYFSFLDDGTDSFFSETSVTDYQPKPNIMPEERRSRIRALETINLVQYVNL
jgi:hypothetical protein